MSSSASSSKSPISRQPVKQQRDNSASSRSPSPASGRRVEIVKKARVSRSPSPPVNRSRIDEHERVKSRDDIASKPRRVVDDNIQAKPPAARPEVASQKKRPPSATESQVL